MATQAQIDANRRNAQSSTGPRTEAGKAASSQNAVTDGLYSRRDYVRPGEEHFYKCFCRTMHDQLAPANYLEFALAEEIASATWRLRLCNNAEAELGDYSDETDKARRGIERARASAHSVLHRSLNQLRKLKAENVGRASACGGLQPANAPESASNCKSAQTDPQIARNAPCPCRSGEKYKRCCGKNAPPVLGKAA
jgi:uncharacterized protein YecA (UPF0149 family)